jgi:putative flippase GtrA
MGLDTDSKPGQPQGLQPYRMSGVPKKEFTLTQPHTSSPIHNSPPSKRMREDRYHLWQKEIWQVFRFAIVGGLNTTIDLLIFNVFLWTMPTSETRLLLIYNSIAYIAGSINSFLLNRHWTFRYRQRLSVSEIRRFMVLVMLGILCNDVIIWFASSSLKAHTFLWTDLSKLIATGGTILISYLGMRLWVFIRPTRQRMKSELL